MGALERDDDLVITHAIVWPITSTTRAWREPTSGDSNARIVATTSRGPKRSAPGVEADVDQRTRLRALRSSIHLQRARGTAPARRARIKAREPCMDRCGSRQEHDGVGFA